MSGTTTVAPARQSFVVEWEEPDMAHPDLTEEVPPSGSALVSVTSAAVRAVRPRRPDEGSDASRAEADRLARAWMQGEPSS
jgi:hypothetical protein